MNQLDEQYHFILAIENLAAARLELAEATKHDINPRRWNDTNKEIDRGMESIMSRIL